MKLAVILVLGFTLLLRTADAQSTNDPNDYDVYPIPQNLPSVLGLNITVITGVVPSTGTHYTGYLAKINNPQFLHIYPPRPGSCGILINTSDIATARSCIYATNGGYFEIRSGECDGNLVSDSTIIQYQSGLGQLYTNFGITRDSLVVGHINATNIRNFVWVQLIEAGPWLIRKGVRILDSGKLIAPRTAVGHFGNGTVVLFQVDGAENLKQGFTLNELSEVLQGFGLYQAVNLDGGGSSVSWFRGGVISKPTCDDTGRRICERAVTSIMCVKQ